MDQIKKTKVHQLIEEATKNAPAGNREAKDIRGPFNWRKKTNALLFAKTWLDLSLKTEGDHILIEDLKNACEEAGLLLEPNKGKNAYSGSVVSALSINNYLKRNKKDQIKFTFPVIISADARKNKVPEDLISALMDRFKQIKEVKDKNAPAKEPETIGADIDWVKDFIS